MGYNMNLETEVITKACLIRENLTFYRYKADFQLRFIPCYTFISTAVASVLQGVFNLNRTISVDVKTRLIDGRPN